MLDCALLRFIQYIYEPLFIFEFTQFAYLIVRNVIDGNGTDKPRDCSDSIRNTHQDTSISWRNVQMVDVIAGNGETAERDAKREGGQCTRL